MVTRQQSLIDRGLLFLVDRGKTVVGVAPTKDVKEISGGSTPAEKVEDVSRISQKEQAQSFPPLSELRAAGAPLILTTSGFEAFKEREKQSKVEPAIVTRGSAFEQFTRLFGIGQRITSPSFFIPRLLRGGARAGAAVAAVGAGVPPQQISPFVLGTERAVSAAVSGGVQSVVAPQGLTQPQGLLAPQGLVSAPLNGGFGADIASAALGRAGESIIRVVLPDQEPAAGSPFDLGLSNKLLIGLGLVAAILIFRKK